MSAIRVRVLYALLLVVGGAVGLTISQRQKRAPAGTSVDPINRQESAGLSTYSIVARDPANGDLGVAVQSKFFGVGSVVPWVEGGVGAIATQSYANTSYGPRGLESLRKGASAQETLSALLQSDPDRDLRQVGIIDSKGNVATHTGKRCVYWAGGRTGTDYTVQGNILVGSETVDAMAKAFESSAGAELAERLMRSLEAGQQAGGDIRGKQSAAIYVSRTGAGFGGNDRYVWLHVEDHPQPVRELRRLLEIRFDRDPLSRARQAAFEGRFTDARQILRAAQKAAPDDPRFALGLATVELEALRAQPKKDQSRGTKALREAIDETLAADPGYDNLYYQAAVRAAKAGDHGKAVDLLRQLLRRNAHYRSRIKMELEGKDAPLSDEKLRAAVKDAKLLSAP